MHGHNLDEDNNPPNYKNNWQEALGSSRPSFKHTLESADNAGLGIEPYYIHFQIQGRSIRADAEEISDAVDLILHRHDPQFDYPYNPADTTHVKVVIIAYSKGTISTRLYLKSLQPPAPGEPEPRPGFRPVSEFIAIAPPNHGISFGFGTTCAGLQLLNGRTPGSTFCFDSPSSVDCSPFPDDTLDFITNLNAGDEAPGSRPATLAGQPNPPTNGTLYVTLFDAQDRDLVGGDAGLDGCDRRLAANLSSNAVNIPVDGIVDDDWSELPGLNENQKKSAAVHRNTVHTAQVICQALYTAVRHRSPVNQTCTLAEVVVDGNTFSVPIIPPPPRAAAVLTLDFSGSMTADARPGVSRAVVLKEAAELFVKLWNAVSVPSDLIGVNYFRTEVEEFQTPGGEELLPLSTGESAILTNLGNQQPRDRTAMGNGLMRAIETLRDSASDSEERRIVLFTDGIQNVNPMARIENDRLTFVNEPGRPISNVSPTAPTVLDPSLGIAVDTIGVGAGEAFVGPLQAIASTTSGRFSATTDPAVDLRRFFVEELINALRGFSPQLVAYRHGRNSERGNTETFAVEDGVRKLVLKVSWQRGESLNFWVAKDGVDVTSAGRFINGEFYKIFVIDLPDNKRSIAARGNWELHIKGKAGTAYETAAIVDGGRITYDALFDARRPRVGDPLDLVVRLSAAGKPVVGNARVTTILKRPTASAGDIIARTPVQRLTSFEPGTTTAEREFLAFAHDRKRWEASKPSTQTVTLRPNSKGEFRAQIRPRVPGIYTAFVTIEGEDAKSGKFTRTATATAVVDFVTAKATSREISVRETNAGGKRYVWLTVSPRDSRGHRMGPGSASTVSVELSAGRSIGKVHDHGDGRYMLLLMLEPREDPTIKLRVAGDELFTGQLSQLQRRSRR